MIILIYLFVLLWEEAHGWGFKNGIFHNSIWLEQAAGVYHREARSGKYKLTYAEAKAVCEYEGGHLATYKQLEAARKIGSKAMRKRVVEHQMKDTGKMMPGHLVKTQISCLCRWVDGQGQSWISYCEARTQLWIWKNWYYRYGIRLNRSERWDAYCYNPHAKECGGVFTDPKRIFKSPGFPNEYDDNQICYWHIRLKYGQRIHLSFLYFDLEDDPACLADYVEVYDSYDDVHGFVGRYCGDELPEDITSTGNVMTLKFISDASVTAGGFQIKYVAVDPLSKSSQGKNASTTSTTSTGNKKLFSWKI